MQFRSTRPIALIALIAALALAACGASEMETGPAIEEANKAFADLGVTMECPDSVDPAADFTCTLTGPGGEGIEVQMKVVEEGGESALDTADQAAFEAALLQAAGTEMGGADTAEDAG
ncbi:MAG: hypothetical protein ACO3RU_14025 [Planctomycetota bacterium]